MVLWVAPYLVEGGPSPIGAQKANLNTLTNDIILQFAHQEVGHLKAIKKTVKGFPRPQLDFSASLFAKVENVSPYQFVVAEFTKPSLVGSYPRPQLDFKMLAGDQFSLAFDRTPEEILRIVHGSGNETVPGGFFPKGGNDNIARSHLHSANGYH
ncbi:hypothetical protein V6N12_040370 [Hibiscus sabdariffa]|uniref:Desiccation-related protein PCC13-62 n=1 Tax=Hibiscus sabdariffa TaxID=183260 RepID=A0ABR2E3K5_9ROSI